MNPPTVPCRWCGIPTKMTFTHTCDRCWELKTRIYKDPVLASRMLEEFRRGVPKERKAA